METNEIDDVCLVHQAAFEGNLDEARLVASLHAAQKAVVSLIAILNAQIVGHVLFSSVRLEPARADLRIVGLAPVGVLPKYQGWQIGTRLIETGLQVCKKSAWDAVVVLGSPFYYARFGFRRAQDYSLQNEYGADEAFMVLELRAGTLAGVAGLVRYADEFREVGV